MTIARLVPYRYAVAATVLPKPDESFLVIED